MGNFIFNIFYYLSKLCLSVLYFDFFGLFLSTTSLNFLKSIGTVFNLLMPKLSTLLFKLFKPLVTFFSLSIPNFSISDYKLVKNLAI